MKAKFRSNKNKFDCNLKSVADPDLQIRGEGRGGGHLDPEIRGVGAVSKKNVFGPSGLILVYKKQRTHLIHF